MSDLRVQKLLCLGMTLLLGGAWGPGPAARPDPGIDRVTGLSRRIDELAAADLERAGARKNPRARDATFLRRAYLDICGRIPTVAEARAFLDSRKTDKRARLVKSLLDSPGYVSHTFNWLADLLRVKSRPGGPVSGEPYIHFLKDAVQKNVPWNELVRQLITANGPAHARGNGATGYYLRDRGMPLDNMANTVRVFLGTRLECAQCHDHPFDKWTRRQFLEMAAFTGGIRYQNDMVRSPEGRKLRRMANEVREEYGGRAVQLFRRRVLRPLAQGISGSGAGLVVTPDDYQYDDLRAGTFVKARTMFGEQADLDVPTPRRRRQARFRGRRARRRNPLAGIPQIDSRSAYADWLTSPANPRFTQVIANRVWKRLMGRGLIEPVDTITDDTRPSNPELLATLEELMVTVGYDLKRFTQAVCATEAWQRRSSARDLAEDEVYHFEGPLMRRMSAEQVWDSLLTLVDPQLDKGIETRSPRAEAVYASFEQAASKDPEELMQEIGRLAKAPDPRRAMRAERARKRRALRKRAQPLLRELARARRRRDRAAEKAALAKLEEMGIQPDRFRRRQRAGRGMARASELRQPERPGHLVRRFGQSDRDQIQSSRREATVPQVLAMLNGFVEKEIIGRRDSALMRMLRRVKKPEARIRTAWLAILGRRPTQKELAQWRKDLARDPEAGVRDLVWTLVNSNEFLFIR